MNGKGAKGLKLKEATDTMILSSWMMAWPEQPPTPNANWTLYEEEINFYWIKSLRFGG